MDEVDADIIFLFEMHRQMFGTIDGTVLPACTTEGDLEIGEVPLDEPLHMMVHKCINGLQERQYLTVILEKINDRLVQSRHSLILLVFTRIVGTAAVKNITATVTGFINRYSAFKRERVNRY